MVNADLSNLVLIWPGGRGHHDRAQQTDAVHRLGPLDHLGPVGVAGLGEVGAVAAPASFPLDAVMRAGDERQ